MTSPPNVNRLSKDDIKRSDTKPPRVEVLTDHIPASLKALPQWVVWRWVRRDGQWQKPPVNARTGRPAKSNDSETWATFAEALACYQSGKADGIGFALTPPFLGVDLDDCRTQTGEIDAAASEIIHALDSYTEVSPSGTGVKLLIEAALPGPGNQKGNVELYAKGRYFTITGHRVPGTPATIEPRQDALNDLHARLFPPKAAKPKPRQERNGDTSGHLHDDELIAKARTAKNGDKFSAVFDGDTLNYPSQSEADMALCQLICFWTGKDAGRVDAIFRQSALMRPKWEREDYRSRTIARAIERQTEFYTPGQKGKAKQSAESNGDTAHNPVEPDAAAQPSASPTPKNDCRTIIYKWIKDTYSPTHKTDRSLFSGRFGRLIRPTAITTAPNSELLESLKKAIDAPKISKGSEEIDLGQLASRTYQTWAKVALEDVLLETEEEPDAAEYSAMAEEQFKSAMSAAMHALISLGKNYHHDAKHGDVTETQQRSVIEWCSVFAKVGVGSWQSVRSLNIWSRREKVEGNPKGQLRVAFRHDLFSQIKQGELNNLGKTRFTRLAKRYGVIKEDRAKTSGGKIQLLELTDEFLSELFLGWKEEDGQMDTSNPSRAPARE